MNELTHPIPITKIIGTPITVKKINNGFWNITFEPSPLNLFAPELLTGLSILLDELEEDPDVKVIVFDSGVEKYFLEHFDIVTGSQMPHAIAESGYPLWIDIVERLAKLPVISIAAIRGRAIGFGYEFAVACDMRFASIEKAVFAQIEVAQNVIPGGGSMENLTVLIGRARALELIIGAEDTSADIAERYGLINRAIADDALDDFVSRFALRISGFDKKIVALAKESVSQRSASVTASDMMDSRNAFWQTLETEERKPDFEQLIAQELEEESQAAFTILHYLDTIESPLDHPIGISS